MTNNERLQAVRVERDQLRVYGEQVAAKLTELQVRAHQLAGQEELLLKMIADEAPRADEPSATAA